MAATVGTLLSVYLLETVLVLICIELLASRSHNLHNCVEVLLVSCLMRNGFGLNGGVLLGVEIDYGVCRYFLYRFPCVNFLFELGRQFVRLSLYFKS